jgi:hypothetical protein
MSEQPRENPTTAIQSLRWDVLPLGEPFPKYRLVLTVATIAICALLIFARLGHYWFWDDEAITVLTAQGILKTGDTSAVLDHNIVAYREGLLIRNLADRSSPPLQFYVVAPFVAIFGPTPFAARLPFALCGIATIAILMWWLNRVRADWVFVTVVAIALIGNVSLMLFTRQARGYGLTMLLTVAVGYLYLRAQTRGDFIRLAICCVLLLFAQTFMYGLVAIALALDYLLVGRKTIKPRPLDAAMFVALQLVGIAVVLKWYNPFNIGSDTLGYEPNTIHDRIALVWWYLRDLGGAEFWQTTLIALAPIVAIWKRDKLLIRALIATTVIIVVGAFLSPQRLAATEQADVRYVMPLIPMFVVVAAWTLRLAAGPMAWVALLAAPVLFWSNLAHFSPYAPYRSTLWAYIGELREPVAEPYTPTIEWVKKNVPDGASIAVFPEHMRYPLMVGAPQAIYAWQLPQSEARPDYASLPPIHFRERQPPDYIVLFGPFGVAKLQEVKMADDVNYPYDIAGTIKYFPMDRFRPELFWRDFTPLTGYNPDVYAIFILKRAAPPPATQQPKSEFRLQ